MPEPQPPLNDDGTVTIVTVHGTGDTAPADAFDKDKGEKWFQKGSVFAERLSARLKTHGLNVNIHPYHWTGANSATSREKAAYGLEKFLSKEARGAHVIGHSHGGNVANDAACMLGWNVKQKKPKLASITTVGTPFFKTHVTWSEMIGAWALFLLVALSALFSGAFLLMNLTEMFSESSLGNFVSNYALPIVVFIMSMVILPIASKGIGRVRRVSRKRREDTSLYTIWHPHDEAIAFLQRIESVEVNPFPKGTFWRGSRTGGIVWGVRAVLLVPILSALILSFPSDSGLLKTLYDLIESHFGSDVTSALLGMGVYSPIIFAVAYGLYRLFIFLVFEMGLRGQLNGLVSNSLVGTAFGRDADNRIGNVASVSHYYAAEKNELSGNIEERMTMNAQGAAAELFDKYRSGVFSVDAGDMTQSEMSAITNDAMTWDSLIHTTYFDQPEVADFIADYVARKHFETLGKTMPSQPVTGSIAESARPSPSPAEASIAATQALEAADPNNVKPVPTPPIPPQPQPTVSENPTEQAEPPAIEDDLNQIAPEAPPTPPKPTE